MRAHVDWPLPPREDDNRRMRFLRIVGGATMGERAPRRVLKRASLTIVLRRIKRKSNDMCREPDMSLFPTTTRKNLNTLERMTNGEDGKSQGREATALAGEEAESGASLTLFSMLTRFGKGGSTTWETTHLDACRRPTGWHKFL